MSTDDLPGQCLSREAAEMNSNSDQHRAIHPDEEATIRAFIVKEKKQRYLDMLAALDKRGRFLDVLNHCRDLDERFVTKVRSHVGVIDELRQRGAPNKCRVISDIEGIDGTDLPLAAAIPLVEEGGWGTILCCLPGQLAYYYDEWGSRRWVLERKPLD